MSIAIRKRPSNLRQRGRSWRCARDVLLAALPVCLLFTEPDRYLEVCFGPHGDRRASSLLPPTLLALLIGLPYLCALLDPTHEAPSPVGVTNIDYDAKGKRTRIDYKNGASTFYAYNPQTFRLIHLADILAVTTHG